MTESQHTEWKASWRDDYLKWICAFANAEGGLLVIGRNDKGQVTGVSDAHRLLGLLPNKVRDLLGIVVALKVPAEQGKEHLGFDVDAFPSRGAWGAREKPGEKSREKTRGRILALIAERPTITIAELAEPIGDSSRRVPGQTTQETTQEATQETTQNTTQKRIWLDRLREGHWEILEDPDE